MLFAMVLSNIHEPRLSSDRHRRKVLLQLEADAKSSVIGRRQPFT